jgi:SAM-dependent methyltransferase
MIRKQNKTTGNEVFGSIYSDIYDRLYEQKDYGGECDMIETLFRTHGHSRVCTVLDLGCGTGNHAIPLSARGYGVTGIDSSEHMLALASQKSKTADLPSSASLPRFFEHDIREFCLPSSFDAAIMMFAVLGYQNSNEDVFKTLVATRKHLKKDAVFVFDVWYGPAVLTIKPSDRVLSLRDGGKRTIRTASTRLDTINHIAEVHYQVISIENSKMRETVEKHRMRFFFPQEIRFFLSQAGFELLGLFPFGNLNAVPTDKDWNVVCVAGVH